MTTTCWICGAKADSAEHRIKRADLVRAFGRGPYQGPSVIGHYSEGRETQVQGPKSRVVKYAPSLCKACNTTGTQPFDRAYDTFIDYVMDAETETLRTRRINFERVFGNCWESGQLNLYKYFAKSFGCRLVHAAAEVPSDVVDLLGRSRFQTKLLLTMAVNEDTLLMPSQDRDGFLGMGELVAWASNESPTTITGYTWNEYVSWLTICYWHGYEPDGEYGSTWVADRQHIYLGSFAPLDPSVRAEFAAKAARRHAELAQDGTT